MWTLFYGRNVYIQDSSFIGFERPDTNYNLRPKKHEGLVFVLPKTLPFKTAVRFERVAADPTCRGSVSVQTPEVRFS